jgi:predicted transposase YbfD/YdcC
LVKRNQPGLYAQLTALPWREVPVAGDTRERGHGRTERRTLKITSVARGLAFPHAAQAIQVVRRRKVKGKRSTQTCYAITSLRVTQAKPAQLAGIIRGHWGIEDRLHWVRDMDFGEDHSQVRTASGPRIMASLQPSHHHPAASRRRQHRHRPALPRPAAQPPTPDDHEVLTDFAGALVSRATQ